MSEAPAPLRSLAVRAERLISLRRADEALAVLGPAIAQAPDQPELLCLAAHAHLVKADWLGALDLAQRAAAADPEAEWPCRLASIAEGELGRASASAQSAYRAVALAPDLYVAHVQYARALSRIRGAEAQAWAEGARAVELAPDEPEVHLLMAQLAHPVAGRPSRDGLRTAEAALHRALELDPGSSAALNDLARIQLRRRRGARAIAGFTEALRADPRNSAALHNVAVVLTTWLRPAHLVVVVATYAALIGSVDPHLGQPVRAVAAAVVVVAAVVFFGRLRRAVPGRVLAVLRRLPVLSRWATAWACLVALTAVSLVVAAASPGDSGFVGLAVAVLAVHAGAVCNWVWVARSRR